MYGFFFFFFKQKTAYEMRISDWSSDVCSSDLHPRENGPGNKEIDHRTGFSSLEELVFGLSVPLVCRLLVGCNGISAVTGLTLAPGRIFSRPETIRRSPGSRPFSTSQKPPIARAVSNWR